jgi:hypothetical protein
MANNTTIKAQNSTPILVPTSDAGRALPEATTLPDIGWLQFSAASRGFSPDISSPLLPLRPSRYRAAFFSVVALLLSGGVRQPNLRISAIAAW